MKKNNVPTMLCLKFMLICFSCLAFFSLLGVVNFFSFQISSTILGIAVKSWPHNLGCSSKRMNSALELFHDLGISKKMVVPVITSSPQLLLRKPDQFMQVCNDY